MRIPLAYLDKAAIEEVDLAAWSDLLAAVSITAPLASYDDLEPILQAPAPPQGLLMALECIHLLGSDEGREAIWEAAAEQGLPPGVLDLEAPCRELAMALFIGQLSGHVTLQDVYVRALIQVSARDQAKRYDEFLGSEVRRTPVDPGRVDQIEQAMRAYCLREGFGKHVQVRELEDDGALIIQVIHSTRTRKPLAYIDGAADRSVIQYRPVHADLLRYDPVAGALRVYARSAKLVPFYRRLAGATLFGDEEWFGEGRYDMTVLQDLGQAALESTHPGIVRVYATELHWEMPDQTRYFIRAADVFAHLERMQTDLSVGQFRRVKLKMEVVRRSRRPVTLELQAPGRLLLTDLSEEALVESFLREAGLMRKLGGADADPPAGLWDLAGVHPLDQWHRALGRDADALAESGGLVSDLTPLVALPDGAKAEVHPVGEHAFYAVPLDSSRGAPTTLSATDVEGYRLEEPGFAAFLRDRWGLTGPTPRKVGRLVALGSLRLDAGSDVLRIALHYAANHVSRSEIDLVESEAGSMILVPPGSDVVSDGLVQLAEALPNRSALIRAVVSSAGLGLDVDAHYLAAEGVRLVVDAAQERAWIDGIEILDLRPGTQPFDLVALLAREPGRSIRTQVLARRLNRRRMDDTSVARQAKRQALKAINRALTDAGREAAGDIFADGRSGLYRCTVPAWVRERTETSQ